MNPYDFYITPDEYGKASENGVDAFNLERRIRLLGWSKEKAMNTPLGGVHNRQKWVKVAEKNGIKYQTFMTRVNHYGWDEKRAATEPIQNRKKAASFALECKRVIPKEYINAAQKHGIAYHTLRMRIKKGWEIERATTEPIMTKSKAGQIGKKRTIEKYGDWNRLSFK